MGYREDLIAARNRYAAELASQQPPPDYSWNEYEEFLLAQLQKIQDLLDRYDAAGGEAAETGEPQTEIISGGYT